LLRIAEEVAALEDQDNYETSQEEFWAGSFGDEYTERNVGGAITASNISLFSKALERCSGIGSVLELGCNVGLNLLALSQLLPQASLRGVDVNNSALEKLRERCSTITPPPDIQATRDSILSYTSDNVFDLVFTKGVLIHIAPEKLPRVYETIYRHSTRYILVAEYYSPKPVEVTYRGHSGKLFKRDFAGELLDAYHGLTLRDYGFRYHRDPTFPQDDITWFLLEKGGKS
jgi:pseudaminic acid biosynthesis-associated methylase